MSYGCLVNEDEVYGHYYKVVTYILKNNIYEY
jgi:hypothetical protein